LGPAYPCLNQRKIDGSSRKNPPGTITAASKTRVGLVPRKFMHPLSPIGANQVAMRITLVVENLLSLLTSEIEQLEPPGFFRKLSARVSGR